MSAVSEGIKALNQGGKRAKIMDQQIVFKLPASIKTLINEVAAKEGVSDATIIRVALAEYLSRRGYRA